MDEPSEQELSISLAAFQAKDPFARHTIKAALSVLPRAPRSELYGDSGLGFGETPGGGGGGGEGGSPGRRSTGRHALDLVNPSGDGDRGEEKDAARHDMAGTRGGAERAGVVKAGAARRGEHEKDATAFQGGQRDVEGSRARRGERGAGYPHDSPRAREVERGVGEQGNPRHQDGGRASPSRHEQCARPWDVGGVRNGGHRWEEISNTRIGAVGHGHRARRDDVLAIGGGTAASSDHGLPSHQKGSGCRSVTSTPWMEDWMRRPLVFHDVSLVRAAVEAGDTTSSLSERISSMLQTHPGPVPYFRCDSHVIKNGCDRIEAWLEVLSKKQVEEVVMANCKWPKEVEEFPLQSLDCKSLKCLRLCFYKIPYIWLESQYCKPSVIDLTACNITQGDLRVLVEQCSSLQELHIGLRMQDDGNITIYSDSIEILQIWWSCPSSICVENAPKLKRLVVGAAHRKTTNLTRIVIGGASMLSLEYMWLNLSSQIISIDRVFISQGYIALPKVRKLELTIQYKAKKQRANLLNFLRSCPNLRELVLWREDEGSGRDEFELRMDDTSAHLKNICCITSCLEVLNLNNYRGGATEIAIACTVLEHGAGLRQLNVITEMNNEEESSVLLKKADQILGRVDRRLAPVHIQFG